MSAFNYKAADFQTRLMTLKEQISSRESLVSDNMKAFFNNKAKFIVFISVCDGNSRACVCKGVGNSVDTGWKSAVDLMNKRIKELNLTPLWVKADIVTDITEYTYEAFIKYISNIKTNYFREGIAFDYMFNTAFLEQEVNANVFIDGENGEPKHIVWKNVNFYIKNNLALKYVIEESSLKNVYTFYTTGFFHDGSSCMPLNNQWLNNGRRIIDKVDDKLIFDIIDKSSKYLIKQLDEEGKFCYGYFPCFDKIVPGYNILRHASTTYSMLEAYETTKNPELEAAIKRSINFLNSQGIVRLVDSEGRMKSYVIEKTNGNEIKLGANAHAILAFSKYTKLFNDNRYLPLMVELAEGISSFQNKDDGSFVHVLNYPDLSVKDSFRTIYYDGEAAFSLMRLYDIDRNECWLRIVEKAFEFFIKNSYWRYHDHWLSYCSNELLKYKLEKQYIEFNLQNASGILDFCLTRETTYPTLLELLMATYNMIERLKVENCYLDTLDSFDEAKFLTAIDHRAEHQLNGLFFPEVSMYFKSPGRILWAFYIRHHSYRVRIDDIEHNISSYCNYLHQRLKFPYLVKAVEMQ